LSERAVETLKESGVDVTFEPALGQRIGNENAWFRLGGHGTGPGWPVACLSHAGAINLQVV
ncbi:MAG: hypothetical protein AAGJ53_08515, partial [Pseudomonadota bacterium]